MERVCARRMARVKKEELLLKRVMLSICMVDWGRVTAMRYSAAAQREGGRGKGG